MKFCIPLFCAALFATPAFAAPDIVATYQVIPDGQIIAGGLKNHGGPNELSSSLPIPKTDDEGNPSADPAKYCLETGPYRAMAESDVKFEFIPANSSQLLMLFQNIPHGNMRVIKLDAKLPAKLEPNAHGTSVAHWEAGTLVIDSAGFDTSIWMNDSGARHSPMMTMQERVHPIQNGQYLEYKITVTDPGAFTKPYSYTRYFEKTESPITEYDCEIEG